MTTEELQIHELAKRAGVSVRTIRYYIEEGLLPEPKYQGKYSYYTLSFLDRLELIRRLKESYLPLREIREIMTSLTDEEVRARLTESTPPSPKFSTQPKAPQGTGEPGARALEYIDRVMEDQTRYKQKGSLETPELSHPQDRNIVFPSSASLPRVVEASPEESWQRISLAPGVELHLRKPMDLITQGHVQRLVNFAKSLFQNKS